MYQKNRIINTHLREECAAIPPKKAQNDRKHQRTHKTLAKVILTLETEKKNTKHFQIEKYAT